MDDVLRTIGEVPAEDGLGPGLVLAAAGGGLWALSLLVGWITPLPLTASLGRAAITASAVSMLILVTAAALLLASAVG